MEEKMTIEEIIKQIGTLSDSDIALLRLLVAALKAQDKDFEKALREQENRIKSWIISMKGNGLL